MLFTLFISLLRFLFISPPFFLAFFLSHTLIAAGHRNDVRGSLPCTAGCIMDKDKKKRRKNNDDDDDDDDDDNDDDDESLRMYQIENLKRPFDIPRYLAGT